jgi:hypothetical protein
LAVPVDGAQPCYRTLDEGEPLPDDFKFDKARPKAAKASTNGKPKATKAKSSKSTKPKK